MIFRTLFSDDSPSPSDHRALEAKVDAINRSQAVIEFAPDGTIEAVNDLFAETMGYDRSEIIGRHHRLFVEETYAQSEEYCAFWRKLARGDFHRGRFRRLAKGGREVWLQATYNPILNADGAPVGVVKFATDITERTRQAAHFRSRIEAIDRSQAVIEFALDGTIETANANFLAFTGYSLDEIQGRHHRMFCDPSYARSPEYHTFWERLRRGEFHSDRFRRVVKGGHEVWIQATYNPILDADGTPIRVIKFATDVTDQVRSEQRLQRGVAMMLDMISEVAASARTIADETEVLAASSQEQSVQSQEVAAAVEEMATTVFENAQSNTRAAELAATSGRAASEGAEVVTNTVDKIQQIAAVVSNGTRIIERLGSSSQRIGEIVATIEDIADQTNLLALNAAIESARAGEHGRGFAVVADEVRKLAERTTRATTEIAEMIETVQGESTAAVEAMREGESEVETGIALADRAGKALGQIVTGTSETGDMISLIAAASEEQSTTSEQISRSVEAISSEAQHSARSIDQIARSVSGLQRLTEDLRHQVHTLGDRFDHGEASPTAPAQATARPSGDGSSAPTPTFSVT